jgi:hypothetical protein
MRSKLEKKLVPKLKSEIPKWAERLRFLHAQVLKWHEPAPLLRPESPPAPPPPPIVHEMKGAETQNEEGGMELGGKGGWGGGSSQGSERACFSRKHSSAYVGGVCIEMCGLFLFVSASHPQSGTLPRNTIRSQMAKSLSCFGRWGGRKTRRGSFSERNWAPLHAICMGERRARREKVEEEKMSQVVKFTERFFFFYFTNKQTRARRGFEFALAHRVQGLASHRAGKGWAGKGWAYYLLQYIYLWS